MKVGFVTGANKGIGFALVERLAKTYGSSGEWDIYLTARDEGRGNKACEELKAKQLNVKFHQLDITDPASRKRFLEFMKSHYPEGINFAVNNAAILLKSTSKDSFGEQARATIATNFTATVDFTLEFLPLLAADARVVNVSSMDSVTTLPSLSDDLYSKFTSPMDLNTLRSLMSEYVTCAEAGVHRKHGWSSYAYGVSKIGLTKASYIMGDLLAKDPRRIVMNSCCPGYVDTDMTDHLGPKTPDEGADTPFYLATLPIGVTEPVNQFVSDRRVQKWSRSG